MIAKLSGILDSYGDDWLIIDVRGVGYLVFASGRTLSRLPNVGEALSLMIETHVREDHIHLFGFSSGEEKDYFSLLQSVQGVGAKVALGILSVLEPDALTTAIASGDKAAVCQANGVGPKLGARIVNELKDKVGTLGAGSMVDLSGAKDVPAGDHVASADAISALANLGYSPSQAHTAIAAARGVAGADARVEDLIRLGLKELNR